MSYWGGKLKGVLAIFSLASGIMNAARASDRVIFEGQLRARAYESCWSGIFANVQNQRSMARAIHAADERCYSQQRAYQQIAPTHVADKRIWLIRRAIADGSADVSP